MLGIKPSMPMLLAPLKSLDSERCDKGQMRRRANSIDLRGLTTGRARGGQELLIATANQRLGSRVVSARLPLLSARPAVTPATLKRAATNFAAW